MENKDLSGKVVVITGAAGRLGRKIVQRFAEDGATIAAVVRSEQQAHSIPFPPEAEGWAFPADVTDEQMVRECFTQIGVQYGRIDALVHAVGTWEARPLLETSLEAWEHMFRINLHTAFLCFREAARLMQGSSGRIIGIASQQGADRAPGTQAAYAAAKAGLIRLVEATAAEFKGTGITAHAVAPSMIHFEEAQRPQGVSAAAVVDLCRYLCTPAADVLNGATLRAYGDMV